MSKKYYVKMKGDVPVEGSLKSYAHNPGYPYKEVSIPSCCDLNKSFTSKADFQGPICTGGWIMYINDVIVPPSNPIVVDITNLTTFVATMNIAYTGIFTFEIVGGNDVKITVLVDFDSVRVNSTWVCE